MKPDPSCGCPEPSPDDRSGSPSTEAVYRLLPWLDPRTYDLAAQDGGRSTRDLPGAALDRAAVNDVASEGQASRDLRRLLPWLFPEDNAIRSKDGRGGDALPSAGFPIAENNAPGASPPALRIGSQRAAVPDRPGFLARAPGGACRWVPVSMDQASRARGQGNRTKHPEARPADTTDREGDSHAARRGSVIEAGANRNQAAVWQGFNYHYICGPHRFGYLSSGVRQRGEWHLGLRMTPGCSGDFVSLRTAAQKLDLRGSRSFIWTSRDREGAELSEEEEDEPDDAALGGPEVMRAELRVGPIDMSCRSTAPCDGFTAGPWVSGSFTAGGSVDLRADQLIPSPDPAAGVPAPGDFPLLQAFIQGVQVKVLMPEPIGLGVGCDSEKQTAAIAFERFSCRVIDCVPGTAGGARVSFEVGFKPGCILSNADSNQSVTRSGIFVVVRLRLGVLGTRDGSVTAVVVEAVRDLDAQQDPLGCGGPPYPQGSVGGTATTSTVDFETMEELDKLRSFEPVVPAVVAAPTRFEIELEKHRDGTPFGEGEGFVIRDLGFEICGMSAPEFRGYGPTAAGARPLRWRSELRTVLSFSNFGNFSAAGRAELRMDAAVLALPGAQNLGVFEADVDRVLLRDEGVSGCVPEFATLGLGTNPQEFAQAGPVFAADCRPNVNYCIPFIPPSGLPFLLPPLTPGSKRILAAFGGLPACMGFGGVPQAVPEALVGPEHE